MLVNSHITPGMTVAVLGLGSSGRAAVRYAKRCGARVIVSDTMSESRLLAREAAILEEYVDSFEGGGHSYDFLSEAELLLISPGVAPDHPVIESLADGKRLISGELALLAEAIDLPVVAVTGTNGKTTVTSLIAEILTKNGKRVFTGGNIGTPLYQYFLSDEAYDIMVVELSSFQLELSGNFAPEIAILLNISPDHLDRHHSLDNYIAAKFKIFANQKPNQLAIVNGDDENCPGQDFQFAGKRLFFGKQRKNDLVVEDGKLILDQNQVSPAIKTDAEGTTALNYAAATLCLAHLGIGRDEIAKGLADFSPPDHRLSLVAKVAGVRYYNDSKATNTGAVIAALESFDCPVVLLAGGRDKGDDYRLLRQAVRKRVKAMLLIGEAAPLLKEALRKETAITSCESLEEAVSLAAGLAKAGEVVLLSPACASFDMFTGYAQRGNSFSKAVQLLQEKGAR